MEFKPKNREWVKNAAIVFLAVLLVLTFFSNTWMNRSLPEVATQSVTDGSITAKVRGTGTVTANGTHQVKADQTREIRAVMVKAGQEVSAGDVLFILGEGDSAEIEAAEEALRALQVSYQKAAVGPVYSYKVQELEIESAMQEWRDAEAALQDVKNASPRDLPNAQKEAAEAEVEAAEAMVEAAKKAVAEATSERDTAKNIYDNKCAEALERVNEASASYSAAEQSKSDAENRKDILWQEMHELEQTYIYQSTLSPEDYSLIPESEIVTIEMVQAAQEAYNAADSDYTAASDAATHAQKELADAEADADAVSSADLNDKEQLLANAQQELEDRKTELAAAKEKLASIEAVIDEILGNSSSSEEYKKAKAARDAAKVHYETLVYNLEQQKATDARSQALAGIDLADLAGQIERARQKLTDLSGGEENQITAKVSGTVQTIDCTAGDTKAKGDVLCSIEVPDMGHTLSFSVTNEQARRLRPGDVGSVSNFYWGNQIIATLTTIQVDPKNPQTNKMLTFDLDGDVNTGSELTISVGQKSANYDTIIPNSAIRSDSNGSFVLAVEARNSPLGNRYVARRVNVEVLASDDMNSAVTAELGYGDYVITTSNAPVKNGDLVRLADS